MATEKMAYKLLINVGGAKTSETQNLSAGKTARIKAQAGVRYQLQDANKNDAPPEQVRVKRVGKDLHVALGEGEEAAQLIIEDYYGVMPEGFNALVGQTEGGSFYEYVLEAPTADSYTLSLTEGQDFTSAVLGANEVSGSGAALAVLAFNPLLAAGAAAGAAGAAAAAGGGGAAAPAPAATVVDTTPPAAPVLNAEDRDANGRINASGTAEIGSTVTVTWPDGTTSTVTAGPDGTWTIESPTVQPAGNVRAEATDASGNRSDPATVVFSDVFRVVISPEGVVTGAGATPGQTVTASLPNGSSVTAVVGPNGTFTLPAFSPVPANGETVSVSTPTGVAGQPAETGTTVAPNTTAITASISPEGVVTGSGATPGQTVTATLPNGATVTAVAGANGTFTLPAFTPVPANGETVSISAPTGVAGQPVETATTVAPDTTPPAVAINEPVTQNTNGTLTVSGTGEIGATVVVKDVNNVTIGTTTIVANGQGVGVGVWTLSSTGPVAEGTLTATATDINGEVGTDTAAYVDSTSPVVVITEPVTQNTNGTLTVSGTGEAGASVVVKAIDGSTVGTATVLENGTWTLTSTGPVAEGTLTATATDINGEVGTDTAAYVDSTSPVVVITEPVTQNTNGTLTVSGTGEAGASVVVKAIDGSTVGTATVLENGTWTLTSTGPVAEGTLTATATDINGEVGTDTAAYVDSTSPVVVITEPVTQNTNGTLTVSGTGEAGASVVVKAIDGSTVGTATVLENGTWTLTSTGPVAEGTLTATATDINGEVGTDTAGYTDNVVPVVVITEPVVQNTNGTLTVSGTGEAGASVVVKAIDGSTVGTATVLENGTWTLTSTGPVAEGTLTATATDINGEVGTDTAAYVDSTSPVVVITEPVTQNTNGTLTVSGTGEAGASVVVKAIDGSTVGTATVLENGTWTLTSTGPVAEGTLTATATDINGEVGTDTAAYVDSTSPVVVITEPVTQNTNGTLTVSGTGEAGASVVVKAIDGSTVGTATVLENGTWTLTSTGPVAEGTLTATATDINGEVGTDTAAYVDSTSPVVVITEPVTQNTNGTLTVSGTGEAGASVVVKAIDGSTVGTATVLENGTWTLTSTGPVAEGTLTATATDINGEVGTDTAGYTDNVVPVVVITEPVVQNTNGTLTVSGTGEAGASVVVKAIDGSTVGTATVLENGTWTLTSTGPVAEGTLTATATDINGEVGTDTAGYTDNVVPVVVITEPVVQNTNGTLTVSGTGEAGASVVVKAIDGSTVGTATVLENGTWTLTSTGPVAEGTLTATATDINGEVGTDTAAYVDSTSPVVVITEPVTQNTNGTLTVSGTGEAGASVVVKAIDGSTVGTATVLENGTWTLTSTGPVAEGTLTATATDINGEVGTDTAGYTDNVVPVVVITEPVVQNTNGTLTVSGTGEAGASVVVKAIDGSTVGTATVLENGTWTLTSTGPVAEGTLTATATDINGEVGTDTAAYVDSTSPVVVITEPVTQNTNGTLTVSGTGEAGASVVVKAIDGSTVGTATVLENGTWTLTSTGPVAEGTLTATATDINGEVGTDTAAYVDSTSPVVVITEPVTQNTNGTLTVSGTGEAGASVVVKAIDGSTVGTATVLENGTWTLTSTGPVAEGTLTATATDINGEVGTDTAGYTDNKGPETPVIDALDSDQDGKINASGTAEPLSTVLVTWPDGTTSSIEADDFGDWAVESPTVQARGTVSAKAMDINGQVSASATVPYATVTNLEVVDTDGNGKPTVSGQTLPDLEVTIEDPSGATHTTTADANGKFKFEIDPAPSPLIGDYSAKATYGANHSTNPVTVTATDLTAPVISALNVSDANTDGKPTISGQVDTPNAVVTIVDPAGATHTVATGSDGVFSLEITVAQGFVEGDYKVTAQDAAGNVSLPTLKNYSEAEPLVINEPVTQNPNGTLTVTGTGEIGATVEVTDVNGNPVGTTTITVNGQGIGTWTVTSTASVPEGTLTASAGVGITATDTTFYENKPVAVDDLGLGTEDSTTLTGNVSTNDTHKDGSEVFTLDSSATGTYGSLVLGTGGAWTYTRNITDLNAITAFVKDEFTYTVRDDAGNESSATLTIQLDPVNDAPTMSVSTAYNPFNEDAGPVAAFVGQLSLADVDSANLSGATVLVRLQPSGSFYSGDVLAASVTAGSGIEADYNATTGLLTLSGMATKAAYQEVLNSVTFNNLRDDISSAARRITWTVTDESGTSNTTLTRSYVSTTRKNDAPVLADTNLAMPNVQPTTEELAMGAMPTGQVGVLVSSLMGGLSDPDLATQLLVKGIAVVGVNRALGELYFSADDGGSWHSYGIVLSLSDQNSLLLRGDNTTRVYFRPHVGVEGTIADAFTFRGWDASDVGSRPTLSGAQVNTYTITATGGTSAYSTATDTVSLTVATMASAGYAGTSGDDPMMIGTTGDDVMVGNGGADQFTAGDGNDLVVLNAANVTALSASNAVNVDGGAGVNTLKLSGADMLLDLNDAVVQGKVHNFSTIDLVGNGHNMLKLGLSDVQSLSGASDDANTVDVNEAQMLVVKGNDGDAVVLDNTASWSQLVGLKGADLTALYGAAHGFVTSHTYSQYTKSGATLFVDELTAVADFVGTVGADALTGTAGADVLFGNGGADTLDGGDGHDKIILNSRVIADLGGSVNVDIDGGVGVNTLTVVGRNLTLDLTNATVFSKLDNFNVLDMHQGGGNEIKISLQEVLALSGAVDDVATAIDESKMLVVQGNASNTTNALVLSDGSNWSQTTIVGGTTMANTYGAQYGFEAGHSYVQYNSNSGAATLFVDQTLIQPVL